MNQSDFQNRMDAMGAQMDALHQQMLQLSTDAGAQMATIMPAAVTHSGSFIIDALMVLMLAGFVGYYVIWNVTPALHAPLMGITNAISSVIIVGAIIAVGPAQSSFSKWLGFAGIVLASINIFGGFVVTNRMLEMFSGKKKKTAPEMTTETK
ncbi:MAG: transhydrogenase subunit alpha part 2 [Alphaproteobacteria bacterium]|nr:transhydrogenase subunit alpha part 2 [Alphaproteobacteria bacterium]